MYHIAYNNCIVNQLNILFSSGVLLLLSVLLFLQLIIQYDIIIKIRYRVIMIN